MISKHINWLCEEQGRDEKEKEEEKRRRKRRKRRGKRRRKRRRKEQCYVEEVCKLMLPSNINFISVSYTRRSPLSSSLPTHPFGPKDGRNVPLSSQVRKRLVDLPRAFSSLSMLYFIFS